MTIDWNNFTPWSSLLGGALIGAAAALFIVFNGRIAGISGVLGGLLRPVPGPWQPCRSVPAAHLESYL